MAVPKGMLKDNKKAHSIFLNGPFFIAKIFTFSYYIALLNKSMLKRILFIFICLVIYIKINAQHNTQFDSSVQINKMAVTGKIWGLIKYYNPVILQKKVDWDMVFINS
ncbi:MAG: hypothetical protein JHD28_08810, partial [Bacteroidia bacterium]|nr:hypothetical protein [Bacteroidia bacterium]